MEFFKPGIVSFFFSIVPRFLTFFLFSPFGIIFIYSFIFGFGPSNRIDIGLPDIFTVSFRYLLFSFHFYVTAL